MNSIRRAIAGERKRLLKLYPISIVQGQHACYSITSRKALRTLNSSKTRAPGTQAPLPDENDRSSNDAVLNEPVIWPKPSEIPWQAKVVNSVNLIGRVKIPVQFEASSDGKCWAGTIISQDDGSDPESSSSLTSFWIPVIFEGDMAHIAMCHLKEKDYVHVAGHLSVDVPPFKLSEVQANVQVMAHSINFVQKFQSKKPSLSEKLHRSATKNSASWRDLLTNPKQWLDNREKKRKGLVKANYPDFSHKDTRAGLWLDKAPVDVLQGLGQLEFFSLPNNNKGENVKGVDSWKHLIENPNKWWDNRLDKKNEKGPDFKNKDSGKALWLGGAPSWALSSLPPLKAKTVDVGFRCGQWRADRCRRRAATNVN
ncbi:hypothetical protein E3N88_10018 [Mikania micrantha]|uniref:Uncharacterized protein n=1 Tax=Mikania micrantha TaxID=192012 RepID=A0A5N6PBS4_9ASTR|nr:hypothetical protein E3N88_10018 [Mikania micrantha]